MTRNAAIWSCLLLVSSLAAPAAWSDQSGQQRAQAAGRALLGKPAPRLTLKTIDGDTVDLGALYGKKAVYLKFWATWCVPCREQMPHFEHVYETAGADLAVIAVDVGFNDSVDAVKAYRKKLGITMPIVFDDGSLGAALHLRVTPTHIVIGRDGRIQYVGNLADQDLDTALSRARAAAPSARAATPLAGASAPSSAVANDPQAIRVGDSLPRRSLPTLDGPRFELRSAGAPHKLTVLVFLSPWCESYLATTRPEVSANCRSARAQLTELASDARVRWLGIASGLWADDQDLRAYRKKNNVTIPLTLDGSGALFRTFRVNDVPTVLIVDGSGRVVRRLEGDANRDSGALRAAVETAVSSE